MKPSTFATTQAVPSTQRFEINSEKMEVNLTDVFVQLDVFSKKVQKNQIGKLGQFYCLQFQLLMVPYCLKLGCLTQTP